MGKKLPAHEVKLGRIRATIWANETKDNDLGFSVCISRLYKSGNDWRDSTSFYRDDLPVVVKALDMAYGWIWRKQVKSERSGRNAVDVVNQVMAKARR